MFIEVTNASSLKLKRIAIRIADILDIQEPIEGGCIIGCIIEVASGNKLLIKESYDDIKNLIELSTKG